MYSSLRVASASPRVASLLRVTLCGLAVVCSACASPHAATEAPSHVAGPLPPDAGQPRLRWAHMEDDGLPAQLAPRHRAPVADDPREPWSPNYGAEPTPTAATAPSSVTPTKTSALQNGVTAFLASMQPTSAPDAEALIRIAVAEHEMRAERPR